MSDVPKPAPCPFCGIEGLTGPDGAFYFNHFPSCWLASQSGVALNCVSMSGGELEQWNRRASPEFICERCLLRQDAKPAVEPEF
jgi:hypothetical protein